MLLKLSTVCIAVVAAAAIGAVVFAQLSDTQTASGEVNVTTTSPDLYICEPDPYQVHTCGPDDSGADETVFESLENVARGERVGYPIRLRNTGTNALTVTAAVLGVAETADPGADCPNGALVAGRNNSNQISPNTNSAGAFRQADPGNDDPPPGSGIPAFAPYFTGAPDLAIFIEPNQAEDVLLYLQLSGDSTENCDGNVWNVSWQFDVG